LRALWEAQSSFRNFNQPLGNSCLRLGGLQTRGIKLVDIFDRKKAKERLAKIKEEADRGYWDDFKELRDSKGKLFSSPDRLIAAQAAPLVPDSQILLPDGTPTNLQTEVASHAATLLCVAFRSGAEEMLASWSEPYGKQQDPSTSQLIELSIVESVVMTWWPFKDMILRGKSSEAEGGSMSPRYLFHFGDSKAYVQGLNLSNKLTGYVFLVDNAGRVRWRGSGSASAEERTAFLKCSQQLAAQPAVPAGAVVE